MLQKFAAESNEFVKGLVAGGVLYNDLIRTFVSVSNDEFCAAAKGKCRTAQEQKNCFFHILTTPL